MIVSTALYYKLLNVFSKEELNDILLNKEAKDYDYIDISTDMLGISYILESRWDRFIHNDFFDVELRKRFATKVCPSKFFSRLGRFDCKTLESLNALFQASNKDYEFREVSGDDILQYYHEDNYDWKNLIGTNSLSNSCMRYDDCTDYIKFYANEPDIRMIIRINKDNDKIIGRSLLWNINNSFYMDRIYGDNIVQEMFILYAITKGYYYKKEQSFKCPEWMFNREEVDISPIYKIQNKPEYFPYMDTFKYVYKYNQYELRCNPLVCSKCEIQKNDEGFCNNECLFYNILNSTEGNIDWDSLFICSRCSGRYEYNDFTLYNNNLICSDCYDELTQ